MLEQIEPRILYSADLNPALASNPALMPQFDQRVIDASGKFTYFSEANAELTRNEVVFVDTATPDYQALVDGIRNGTQNALNTDVVVLDADTNGISQISDYLAYRQDVSAIHIISHGSDAAFQLGSDVLNAQSLRQNADQISLWGNSLTSDADLMIYGCDVAGSDAGRALIDSLARLSGADVAASMDLTGNAARGGDWKLEYQAGRIEASVVIGTAAQQDWLGVLNTAKLAPSQDSYVNTNSANTNYGANASMVVDISGGGLGSQHALMQFDVSSMPANATISSATLTVNATANGGATNLNLYRLNEAWTENQVTWNERVTGTNWGTLAGSITGGVQASLNTGLTGLHSWTVTTLVQSWYATPANDHGLMIAGPDTGGTTVTYESNEGTTAPQLVINYTVPQAAPVLSGANSLTTINEDPGTNGGTLLSALLTGNYTDVNTEHQPGIAVTAVDNTNGTWQYSTDSGGVWNDFGAPTTATARLRSANGTTYVRFVPDADWNGTVNPGMTFKGWDQTTGTAGATADVTLDGGTTAFSSAIFSSGITVTAVNDVPTVSLANVTTTFAEDLDLSSRVKVADIVITDDGQGTNVLSLTGTDAALFEIIGTELFLKAGASLNFKTTPLLDVTVEVNDPALAATPADSGATWWDPNWLNRRQITFDNSASGTNLLEFRALVKLTAADIDFNKILPGGTDIRFIDNGGATLDYEIDSWDDVGKTAALWVRVPQIDAGSTTDYIHRYYNNTGAAAQPPTIVWPGGHGVYHLDEDPGPGLAGDIKDSDGTALNGQAFNMASNDVVTGKIGKAIDFDGSDDYIDFASTDVGNTFTISAWIKPDSSGTAIQTIAANSNGGAATNGFRFFVNSSTTEDGKILFETGNGGSGNAASTAVGVINFDEWNHVAVTVDRTAGTAKIYHNGVDVTLDGTIRTDFSTSSDWEIGRLEGPAEFTGTIDEFRLSDPLRFADWINAPYLNQSGTFGSTRFGGEGLVIAITDANDAPVGLPVITGTVTEDQILTADASGITDEDGLGVFGYQWLRGGVAISGATANTYTLGDADVGALISVEVSYSDGQAANETVTSAQTAAIANVNDNPVGVPTITGTVAEDQILTADTKGISDADGLGAFSYQWLRGGVASGEATASTYTLGHADVGTQITVRANYSDGQGTTESVNSATTTPVVNINDAPIGSANTVLTLQNTAYAFGAGDFGFSDPSDNPANSLLAVRIAALPTAGTLTDNGVPVVAGQFVTVADINAGWLVFTPATGANGAAYSTFTFQVQDDGAGSDMDLIARALTMNVNAPAVAIPLTLFGTPTPVVDAPLPPVGSVADSETAEQAPTDEEATEEQTETVLLAAAGSSTGAQSQSGLGSQVLALKNLSGSQPIILRPELQRSSHSSTEYGSPIKTDIWLDFLNSLNSSQTTTQVSGENISVIMDRTDFGETSDEQFFSLESGLQLSGVALSAGFVSWAIRGAGLFASLLTSLPAWRHMDPLPILKKKDEKEKEKDWTLRENDDGHDFGEDIAVRNLWTPGNGIQPPWSGGGDAIFALSGEDTSKPGAESIMNFLEHIASRDDAPETEKPAYGQGLA
jgi:hypothetical protein